MNEKLEKQMKVVRVSHFFKFTLRDGPDYIEQRSPAKDAHSKGGIPRSRWQISTLIGKIRNDSRQSLQLKVFLKNYKDFKIPGNIAAFGNVLLRDFGDVQAVIMDLATKPALCSQFDLKQTQLNNLKEETVWIIDLDNVRMPSKYIFDVKIYLVFINPVPNLSKMQSDFAELMEHGDHSDFLIVATDREFKVHKSILSARSTVFQAMLKDYTIENQESRVEIPDVRSEVLETMLIFMYSGKLSNCDKLGEEWDLAFLEALFNAADKYDVSDLRKVIGDQLCYGIDAINVSKRLFFAEQFEELSILKRKCAEYIRDNCDAVWNNTSAKKKKKVAPRPIPNQT